MIVLSYVSQYFLSKDKEIKPLLQKALRITKGILRTLIEIFNKESYPLPYGFNVNEDVDVNSPRLYSDSYFCINSRVPKLLFKDTVSIYQYLLGLTLGHRENNSG
ncbi:DUF3231 family protein [Mesobacillus foraminis]|uniref:DUF3231 family protein n=1 Tax=Mesobacillus foraminis TaxID=279826 RepID=UPI001BE6119B|nr:DUF3231 family protein [Mesobacillus foraminis]